MAVVIGIEPLDLDSIRSEQRSLCVNDGIFSAALLIPIVNHQNFHLFLCVIALAPRPRMTARC